ncbi:MAG TPA: septum formation initiator family protein [Anaeromyxobacteraceae bacterium]|nr:septum formation initiator family protein [Anaeromyxobacteraceae bacterium]
MSSYRRRKILWVVSVAAVLTAAALAFDGEGLKKYRLMRDQTAQLRDENAQLEAEIARLTREAQALRSNPAALERAAREELRFIRPGELIYRLDAQPGGTP